MPRALCLSLALLALPLASAPADAPPDLGANAALKYWQAFATLPKLTDAEQTKLNADCLTMPLDAHARDLVTKADYALKMMHYGAALPRCDWGYPYKEGVEMLLPQGPAARTLSALACLRIRLRFEDGQSAAAVDDVVATMAMGRQMTREGVLILVLVGYAIEARMGEALALDLPKLDAKTIKDLKARLDALPLGTNPAAAMRAEEKFGLDWFVRKVKEAKGKDSLLSLLALVTVEPEGKGRRTPAEKARTFLAECGGTAEGVLKRAEEIRPSYERTAKMLELPPDQFEKEFARETAKHAGNPVFNTFFPGLDNVRRAQARADVRRALLAAALAVQLDGRDALKNYPDPVAGGPFEYALFDGGFELRSKLKGRDNKPVTLTVGRRGK
jgi:hypothetical protein